MKNKIHHIVKKGSTNTATQTEKQELLSLFHQPEKEFELKEELLRGIEAANTPLVQEPNYKKLFVQLWRKIEQNNKKNTSKTRFLYGFAKIAAAVVIGLFTGLYIHTIETKPNKPVYYATHSPKGSVSEMLLPDGSVIFLNAGSKIKYSVDGESGQREVFLSGEAWFEVAKNEKKPFLVHTPYYDVKVTGTKFNVKAYDSDKMVTTTLEEGQVIVQSSDNLKLAENIILHPGEQLVFDKQNKTASVKNVNTKWYTSWKDNKLVFVNMDLKELVVVLERKYGVEIEVTNKEILDLHFDGTIKNETIIEFLEIVKKTLPINYKIADQKIEISNKKNKR
ncbi:FecR family protein [Draconibacterium sp.]|jgi:ferric-dicitrate binding protein FerR (iron transport regulator)